MHKPRIDTEDRAKISSAFEVDSLPITAFLRQFDPLEVLIWLSATAAYPCNAVFLTRISLAIALILAARGTNSTLKPQRSDIERLFALLEEAFGEYLHPIEDYIPFDNLSDLKVGWKGNMYRFFFGSLERPLAYTQKLIREYALFDDYFLNEYGFTTQDAFEFTLNYHDSLLSALVRYDSKFPLPRVDPNQQYVQVPPPEFVKFWRFHLPIQSSQLRAYITGPIVERGQRWIERYTHSLGNEFLVLRGRVDFLNDRTFISIRDNLLAPLPQFGISQLYEQFQGLLASSQQFAGVAEDRYRNYTMEQTWRLLNQLFSKRYAICIPRPVFTNGQAEAKIPMCVLFDVDKIFLVDVATSWGGPAVLQRAFDESLQRVRSVKQILKQPSRVSPADPVGHATGRPIELPANLETFTLIILNAPVLDEIVLQVQQTPSGIFDTLQLLELEAFALECKDSMEFCKFLRSWEQIKQEAEVIYGGILNAFAYYRANRYAFIRDGTQPNFVMFDPHGWSWEEAERLAQRAPTRHILIEEGLSDLVELMPIEDNAIRVFDRETRVGLMIIPGKGTDRRLVLRLAGPEMHGESDVEMNETLGEGIRFYFGIHAASLEKFIGDHLGYEYKRLEITLLSETTAEKLYGQGSVSAVFDPKSKAAISSLLSSTQEGSRFGVVVYNTDRLVELLQGPTNEAERQLMNAILITILPEYESVISNFVDAIIPPGKKALAIVEMTFPHILDRLREPTEPHLDDISWVNREIALQLKREGITPGRYEKDEATRINNTIIYPFLMSKLLNTIADYPATELLIRAYSELEQFEANRQQRVRQISSDARTIHLEYDPVEKIAKLQRDTTAYVSTLSTLIEIIVKSNPLGDERLSTESWHRIFALAKILFQTAIISEAIHFGIQSVVLVINGEHGFSDDTVDNEGLIDLESFRLHDARLLIPKVAARVKAESVSSQVEYKPLIVRMPELIDTDKAFTQQFGVSLEDFLVVMVGLASYPSPPSNPIAPLIAASRSQMVNQLVKLVENLTPQTANGVLDHLILTKSQLEHEDIEPWRLRSRRYRLTTHPVLQINSDSEEMLLFGTWFVARCGQIFSMYLERGSLPFPYDILSNDLNAQLSALRQNLDDGFEEEVRAKLREAGFQAERIKSDKLMSICGELVDDDPGEIDALFPQIDTQTLWVVEAKNVERRITPREMRTEINKFFEGKRNYSSRLEKKVNAVGKCLERFLDYFGVKATSSWQVRGVFVMSQIIPSAFVRKSIFPFFTIETFLEMLGTECKKPTYSSD